MLSIVLWYLSSNSFQYIAQLYIKTVERIHYGKEIIFLKSDYQRNSIRSSLYFADNINTQILECEIKLKKLLDRPERWVIHYDCIYQ